MAQLLLYIKVFEALTALIRQVVDMMNQQFPEANMGKTKLAIATQYVTSGLTSIENAEHFVDRLTPMVPGLISTVADGLKLAASLKQA